MQILEARRFGYPLKPWLRVLEGLGAALLLAAGAGTLVFHILWRQVAQSPRAVPFPIQPPWWMPLLFLCGGLLVAGGLMKGLLRAQRAFVEVSAVGIAVTDWRGREKSMLWDEVTRLCVGALSRRERIVFTVQSRTAILQIDAGVEDSEGLLDEIRARASLTEHERLGLMDVYERPVPTSPEDAVS